MDDTPGFIVHNPENTIGQLEVEQNKAFLKTYLQATEQVHWETIDWQTVVRPLAAQSAHYSQTRMRNIVAGCWLLHTFLPRTKEHGLALGVIGYAMLRTLWSSLVTVSTDPEYRDIWNLLDVFIVHQLTAAVPNQALPTTHTIKQALRDELVRLGIYAEFEDTNGKVDFDPPTPNYGVTVLDTGNPAVSVLQVTLPTEDAVEAQYTIKADAKQYQLRHDQVVMNRLCGEASQRDEARELRIYGVGELVPTDRIDIIATDGTGRLTANQRRALALTRKIAWKNIDAVAELCHSSYHPNLDQIIVTKLRDGTCRYPGCTIAARYCDVDHVTNYAQGGWTTLSNLQCLCRTHHNTKTDRHIHATSDIYGTITWHINNTTITTIPTGPLAGQVCGVEKGVTTKHAEATEPPNHHKRPPSKHGLGRWGQTLQNYRDKLAKYQKLQLTYRKRQLRDYDDIPPLTDDDAPET